MKLPYAVVYIDHAPTEKEFTTFLNAQWKEGWDYVAPLDSLLWSQGIPTNERGKQHALLMKKRDFPQVGRVIDALTSLWRAGNLTTDELFMSCTAILSDDPSELLPIRAALRFLEPEISENFEKWLRGLRDRPTLAMSNGRVVVITEELLKVLAEENKSP